MGTWCADGCVRRGDRSSKREETDCAIQGFFRSRETEADKVIIDRIGEMAKTKGISMAGVATAWCLAKGTVPILGLNSKERIDEAVQSSNIELGEEDINYLEEPYVPKRVMGH
jgi:versiconal hemiacetal acetate reductase